MSVNVRLSPQVTSLAKAIGLVGVDGDVDAAWFRDPIERLRTIISDPHQRAALFALLETLLPSAPPGGSVGAVRWHPLLEPTWKGNVYVTVEGDVIGVAAAIETASAAAPTARASIRVPLVDGSTGSLEVIAGSSRGPLHLTLAAGWGATARPSAIAVDATVDIDGHATFRVAFNDLDPDRPGSQAAFDPTRLDADATRALVQLLCDVVAKLGGGEPVARVAAHLPAVLGVHPGLEPVPLHEMLRDPGAAARWFGRIAAGHGTLDIWFEHLAGLLGAGLPTAPGVSGTGAPGAPFRSRLVELGAGAALELTLAATVPAAGAPELLLGVALALPAAAARVEATATLFALPLDGVGRARLVPSAHLALTAPGTGTLIDRSPAVKVGSVSAGLTFDGTRLVPRLELIDAMLSGKAYPRLDLTDANALGEVASGAIAGALDQALGTTGLGRALQALVGLVPPASDPSSPHRLSLPALVTDPTRAIAEIHRGTLGDPAHPWRHLLAELATLLQLPGTVTGDGTPDAPWQVTIAELGPVRLGLAAWNAREATTAAGSQLLRLGLRVGFDRTPWSGGWLAELLAFDLRAGEPTAAAFLAGQHLAVRVAPGALPQTATGLALSLAALSAEASWKFGGGAGWRIAAQDLRVTGSGGTVGPVTLTFPSASFDAHAPDLGLGIPVATSTALIRLLLSQVLYDAGGPAAFTLGALLGLHRALLGLPADWPLLAPPVPGDLGSLLEDPLAAIRHQLERVAGGSSQDGTPFAVAALPWIAALLERVLPDQVAGVLAGRAPDGLGTHSAPWVLPVSDGRFELLCWLAPDGPSAAWHGRIADRVREAAGSGAFASLIAAVAPLVPELADALRSRGTAEVARQLERLGAWLSVSDGLVWTAAQSVERAGWTTGELVRVAHHDLPAAPDAIAQIRTQLDAWAGPVRAVLLVGPPFADHRAWADFLHTVEPACPAEAHFDLRIPGADPLAIALEHVAAVATHYTADLVDGPLAAVTEQLARVVERIQALTGQPKVFVVAHSTAGVAARVFAAAQPTAVAGVITLGTPHDYSPLAPLTDDELADAVRLAEALQPASGRTPVGRAIARLAEALSGAEGYRPEPFPDAPRLADTVPGLAIPGWLDGDLLQDLADGVLRRITDVAQRAAPATHVGIGARFCLDVPAEAGALAIGATLRVDALTCALGAAARRTGPLGRAIDFRLALRRERGWLAGGPGPRTPRRLRWAELGGQVVPADTGGVTVTPILRLHEVGASARSRVTETDLLAMTDLPTWAPLPAELPPEGSAERLFVDVLQAAELVQVDGTGRRTLAIDALLAMLAQPATQLGPRLPAIADRFAGALGAHVVAGGWSLPLGAAPLEIAVTYEPWSVALRSQDAATGAEVFALAPGLAVGLEAHIGLPSFAAAAEARIDVGESSLAWSSSGGTLTLSDGFSAAPLVLVPPPSPAVLRSELARRLPILMVSGLASAVLDALSAGRIRIPRIARLLALPGTWLVAPDGLGAASGDRLDGAKITTLLESLGSTLGLATAGGLALPGGLTLHAMGSDPVVLAVDGVISLGTATDSLGLAIGIAVGPQLAASPSGEVTLTITLPGDWGQLAITVGAHPSGLALAVAPAGRPRIELLPQFSGFGALATGAVRLLPRVLQSAVNELAPQPQNATGVLRVALQLAHAVGLYDFDAQGFEAPDRAAELTRMLDPGWLPSKVGSGPAITQLVAGLFAGPAPLVAIPGTVAANDATVAWTLAVPVGGSVTASLGWSGAGVAAEPMLLFRVGGLRLGPVVADELAAGYAQGIACHVALHLEPGGELAFFEPAIDVDVVDGRVSFEAYPLGSDAKADLAIRIAPTPEVIAHPEAALAFVERWGVPLAARLLLRELGAQLDVVIWPGGPTIRAVVEQAGLVEAGSDPPALAPPRPLAELALRALAALVSNITIELISGQLWLILVEDAGRRGLRIRGRLPVSANDVNVDVRFGVADWLTDPDAGVTLWLLEDVAGIPPVRITPGIEAVGLGVVLSRADAPLLEGAFEIGAAGGFVFLDLRFLDASRALALDVSRLGAGLELDDAQINVSSDDGDSFLKKVLPKELAAPFDLAVAWREGEGLTLYGGSPGGGLELTFPLDLDLKVIRIEELFVALQAAGGTVNLQAALSGSASLGPLFAFVQRVGLKVSFAASGTQLGFRAPDGMGLSIDAGPVSGGGFLFIDEPRGQYAGALQLKLQTISITAIGLLNTRMPDGSPIPGMGFSLLIIIAVELPPIQLGFGFTLNGIGGLLGLNRTIDLPALRAGVRTRALDAMMFPPDPVANAAAVVRSLSTVFPVAVNRFVVGPMVRLGWGTPPILTLDIGILLELPAPIRVVVLGRIKLALPQDSDVAVVAIHMDIVGIIDFGRGEISIDAVLYDSLIAGFTLTGDMALRARWKDDPTFVLSIGGFHPAFQPPPDFPTLARVALSLATGDNPRLRFETYLAVTSNTVQLGAMIDLHAEAAGFTIDGNVTFDALIQFDPFGLMVDMSAAFAVRYQGETICSVSAEIHLTGPSPWHVWGQAKVEVLLLSATVSFDAQFGPAPLPPPRPAVRVCDLLIASVAEPANWSAQPPSGEGVVSLRSRPGGDRVLAHPLGGLTFRQRIVPLELTLECYGAATVDGVARFEITSVACGGRALTDAERQDVRDAFAPAQYLALTDDDKLSRPSFEQFTSGVALAFDGWQVDELAAGEAAQLGYEVIVVDSEHDRSTPGGLTFQAGAAVKLASSAAAATSQARRGGLRRFEARAATVRVAERRFTVAGALDGRAAGAKAGNFAWASEQARRHSQPDVPLAVVGVRGRRAR